MDVTFPYSIVKLLYYLYNFYTFTLLNKVKSFIIVIQSKTLCCLVLYQIIIKKVTRQRVVFNVYDMELLKEINSFFSGDWILLENYYKHQRCWDFIGLSLAYTFYDDIKCIYSLPSNIFRDVATRHKPPFLGYLINKSSNKYIIKPALPFIVLLQTKSVKSDIYDLWLLTESAQFV